MGCGRVASNFFIFSWYLIISNNKEISNIQKENVEITTLILDKADFRTRKIIRDKEEYYKIIRGSIL